MTTQRTGAGIGVSLDELTGRMPGNRQFGVSMSVKEAARLPAAERKCDINMTLDEISQYQAGNGKRNYDVNVSLDEISATSSRKYDLSMSLDEISQVPSTGNFDINMSLDAIARLSRSRQHEINISLDEMSPALGKRKIDETNLSLAEIIHQRKIEAPKKRYKDSDRATKSKWERYNKSDTEEEEEEEDEEIAANPFIPSASTRHIEEEEEAEDSFVPARFSSDDSDDEPISLPMHAGLDDEDRREISSDCPFSNDYY